MPHSPTLNEPYVLVLSTHYFAVKGKYSIDIDIKSSMVKTIRPCFKHNYIHLSTFSTFIQKFKVISCCLTRNLVPE